jgi:hypothetical protein
MNLSSLPTNILVNATQSQAIVDYHRDYVTELLLETNVYTEHEAIDLASKMLNSWYDTLFQQGVDDINGIPLTIEMLPVGVDSFILVERAFNKSGIHPLQVHHAVMCWNILRGDLYTNVFNHVESDGEVDLAITLGSTIWMVPDNNLGEDKYISLRLFSSKQAAQVYSDFGYEGCKE